MVVLVVDDQISVVGGIVSGVNWEEIGVNKVLKAFNALEAKEIINDQVVDIMLCDIEMPVESGLSLFRWVKNQKKNVECIFLTAHADFFYAKQAVQLGSFDYILQPARYEDIQVAVNRAVEKVKRQQELHEYSSYGKMMHDSKHALIEGLLRNWFCGDPVEPSDILKNLKKLDINIDEKSGFFLILLNIMSWKSQIEEWNDHLLKFAFTNIVSELFERNGQKILLVQLDRNNFEVLVYTEANTVVGLPTVIHQLDYLIVVIQEYFKCSIACYTGENIHYEELSKRTKLLLQMRDNNVSQYSRVFVMGENIEAVKELNDDSKFKQWTGLILNGCVQIVQDEMCSYLDELSSGEKIDAETMKDFYQNFMQLVFVTANRLSIPIQKVLAEKEISDLSLRAYRTIDDMKAFIKQVIPRLVTPDLSEKDTKRQIDLIIQYIQNNIEKDIRRLDISQSVYLNVDYISRLFKKEMGVSLKEFIVDEKMKVAQTLLQTTSLPISTVAAKVGFDNFSHFSQVFKKVVGITPAEKRQNKSYQKDV